MYKYKVNLSTPNHDVLEFESKLHISLLQPEIVAEDICMVHFSDVNVVLNLANISEMEINGRDYQLVAYSK
nr:hypothetical protein [Lysinibacillus timonensis]